VYRKLIFFGITGICLLAFAAFNANAIEYQTCTFALNGSGSFMDTWVYFTGDIVSGTLAPGTFWVKFDSDDWDEDIPETPNNERWDYIFSTFFTYDDTPGNEGWDGSFSPVGEPPPTWRFYTATDDTLGGLCAGFLVNIRDYDADGVLDEDEYATKTFSTNLIAYINYSGGCFNNWCGQGSMSGTLNVIIGWEEELYVPSVTSASGRLYLRDDGCSTGVQDDSWGGIKSIYKD
jgi:hypothetical protein